MEQKDIDNREDKFDSEATEIAGDDFEFDKTEISAQDFDEDKTEVLIKRKFQMIMTQTKRMFLTTRLMIILILNPAYLLRRM